MLKQALYVIFKMLPMESICYSNFLKASSEDMFIDFRERGRGWRAGGEREKHQCERET